jgi:hypothetical protein
MTTTSEMQDLAGAACAGKTHASIAIEMHAGQSQTGRRFMLGVSIVTILHLPHAS